MAHRYSSQCFHFCNFSLNLKLFSSSSENGVFHLAYVEKTNERLGSQEEFVMKWDRADKNPQGKGT